MKKSELKNIIKECVKEVLFEEGVLSNLVAEVAFGITKAQTQLLENTNADVEMQETKTKEREAESKREKRQRLLETKRKMLNAMGTDRMKGVFEGTEPLPNSSTPAHSPLSGRDPRDAGVDISGLFSVAGQKWQNLK